MKNIFTHIQIPIPCMPFAIMIYTVDALQKYISYHI